MAVFELVECGHHVTGLTVLVYLHTNHPLAIRSLQLSYLAPTRLWCLLED